MFVSCCIGLVFVFENFMQNMLMFSGGMEFSILGLFLFGAGVFFFYIMLLGGISKHIG
jgi:hypothetical protein